MTSSKTHQQLNDIIEMDYLADQSLRIRSRKSLPSENRGIYSNMIIII